MWEEETKQYSDPESAKKSGADCQVSTRINYSKHGYIGCAFVEFTLKPKSVSLVSLKMYNYEIIYYD